MLANPTPNKRQLKTRLKVSEPILRGSQDFVLYGAD